MTMPAPTFAPVAPPADGLAMAFTAARRRRNSKAAVTAFGGAVAIASVLSLLAPPGQTLVQQPLPPAQGGAVPGVAVPPTSPVAVRSAPLPTAPKPITPAVGAVHLPLRGLAVEGATAHVARIATTSDGCPKTRRLACAVVHTPASAGDGSVRANLCSSSAAVTVDYAAPGSSPTRARTSRTVTVGADSCDGS